MSWQVFYTVREFGLIAESASSEADAGTKVLAASTAATGFMDIGNKKVRREDIIVVEKVQIKDGG